MFLITVLIACQRKPVASVTAFSVTPSNQTTPPIPCPQDMRFVQGMYCPSVEEVCLKWVDAVGNIVVAPIDNVGRCAEFRKPTRCLTPKTRQRYCIDAFEWPNVKGRIPQSWMSWNSAKNACEAVGKRLCTGVEWTFACEGEEIKPYPYGDGYHRDRNACNIDDTRSWSIDVFHDTQFIRAMDAFLVPSGSMPRCVSPFGVYDMVGNIDEETVNDSGRPYASALRGGHMRGLRNACRPSTIAHDEQFAWYETGSRCCASAN